MIRRSLWGEVGNLTYLVGESTTLTTCRVIRAEPSDERATLEKEKGGRKVFLARGGCEKRQGATKQLPTGV